MGAVHFQIDDAWEPGILGLQSLDLRDWGPRLRYFAPAAELDAFVRDVDKRFAPFVLYGSGDFHYLAGAFVRRLSSVRTIVSFDNHPDWDVRPPPWACGGWVNRALDRPDVSLVSVWGCGNFELAFPSRLFANRAALRSGRLQVNAWSERQSPSVQRRFDCMKRQNWRERFEDFAQKLEGQEVYVTVDLDCLRAEEAVTNWENGLFMADEVAWAIERLHASGRIVGGDVCGARSTPAYARPMQRLAGWWDHPRLPAVDAGEARRINAVSLQKIWPALAGNT